MLSKKKNIAAAVMAGVMLCTLNSFESVTVDAAPLGVTLGITLGSLSSGKKDNTWKTSLPTNNFVQNTIEKSTGFSWILDPAGVIEAAKAETISEETVPESTAVPETVSETIESSVIPAAVYIAPAETETIEQTLPGLTTEIPESLPDVFAVFEEEEAEPQAPAIAPELENKVLTIVESYQNIRETPSEEGEIVGRLYSGGAGEILEDQGAWIRISSGDVEGWICADYTVSGEEAQSFAKRHIDEIVTVKEDGVRIREEASSESARLETVDAGTTYILHADHSEEEQIDEQDVAWTMIKYEDGSAFVCSDFVEVVFDLGEAKSMEKIREEEAARIAAEKAAAEKAAAEKAAAEKAAKEKAAKEKAAEEGNKAGSVSVDEDGWVCLGQFKITAYCGGACCNGKWAGTTSSGATPREGRTIAVNPSIIPYGTQVRIEGLSNTYVAEDTGGFAKRNPYQIDLFFADHGATGRWGVTYRNVWVKR